jgi:PAT family beta-lactamase induction signal transducer AmpG
MLLLGFSAGLPYLLVFSTLSAWLRDAGVSHSVIGFFSWVGVTYSSKVLLAPAVDRLALPWLTRRLGKRRSWLLVAQLGIVLGLFALAKVNVQTQLMACVAGAIGVALCSAVQDIVIDAYRIESASVHYQGAMAATYVLGYRLALLVSGAGAFYLAAFFSWSIAYALMAVLMLLCLTVTLYLPEPRHALTTAVPLLTRLAWSTRLHDALVNPFVDFFQRNGITGLLILAIIALYKLSDMTMGVMANPFYLDLGFSKTDIADVGKVFGFMMTLVGAAVGGSLVARFGLLRPLLLGALLIASTNLLFAWLAMTTPQLWLLALVISADNLGGGIASSVFIAYLSSLTSSTYTATQYALFSSLMTLPAQLLGGFSGLIVEQYGYVVFFCYTALLGLPAMALVGVLIYQQRGKTL